MPTISSLEQKPLRLPLQCLWSSHKQSAAALLNLPTVDDWKKLPPTYSMQEVELLEPRHYLLAAQTESTATPDYFLSVSLLIECHVRPIATHGPNQQVFWRTLTKIRSATHETSLKYHFHRPQQRSSYHQNPSLLRWHLPLHLRWRPIPRHCVLHMSWHCRNYSI